MKAVNLIPSDARRSGAGASVGKLSGVHVVLALLAVALGFTTLYVVTSNTISSRKAHLSSLEAQVAQMQSQVTRLNSYAAFEKLAQARAATVRQIAATRFDWHAALSDLSHVVPANTTLTALTATVAPGVSVGAGGTSGSVRADIAAPAFELKGCTATQDDVARLMSQLRVMNDVNRVTLEDSAKGSGGASAAVSSSSTSTSAGGCPPNGPAFDMVVFFQPMTNGAGTVGGTGQPVSTTTSTSSSSSAPSVQGSTP